jgi:hypothetical protein
VIERPLLDQVRERMAQHVGYEIKLAASGFERRADVLAFEACLLHVRSLIEFFVGRPSGRKPSDIWPTDFDPEWTVDGVTLTRLRGHLTDIDRYLSHLSLARADDVVNNPDQMPFALPTLFGEVMALAATFVDVEQDFPGIGYIRNEVADSRKALNRPTPG